MDAGTRHFRLLPTSASCPSIASAVPGGFRWIDTVVFYLVYDRALSLVSNGTRIFFLARRTISPSNLWLSAPLSEICPASPSPMLSIQSVLCLYSECVSYWQSVKPKDESRSWTARRRLVVIEVQTSIKEPTNPSEKYSNSIIHSLVFHSQSHTLNPHLRY